MLLITTVSFFMMRAAPGGPFDKERIVRPEIEAALKRAYHLDESLPMQFLRYLGNLLRGDFGPSFQYKDFTVTELIWGGFPTSLRLGGSAILCAFFIGTALGACAALRQNSWLDVAVMAAAMSGMAIPNYVMAPLLSLIFGI